MRLSARGFTLIELLISVALVVIVLTIAAPAFREMILNNQRATHLNAMLAALNLARAEAVKGGGNAIACISDGNANPDCDGAATDWQDGWLVIFDTDKDGVITVADGDRLVEVHASLPGTTTLIGNANVLRTVEYNARGSLAGLGATITHCDSRGAGEARGIVIHVTGRPRVTPDNTGLLCPP